MASSPEDPTKTRECTAQTGLLERASEARSPRNASGSPLRSQVVSLEGWFRSHARDLPWRRHRSPWRSLVSELMLQQTQVSRIAERFEGFMSRFPSPNAMVEAGEDEVLAAWEGLGYYRRARLLHAAANRIVDEHRGEVPSTMDALEALPGVGKYTAGAVASIVFNAPVPIVDGNVVRVAARVLGIDRRADDSVLMGRAWRFSTDLVEAATDPSKCNEGLMELGATVCTPQRPDCSRCPLRQVCVATTLPEPDAIPRPKVRPVRQIVHLHLALIQRGDRLLLEQRPSGGLWGGLWQPIGKESPKAMSTDDFLRGSPVGLLKCEELERRKRQLTHRTVHIQVYRATTRVRSGFWATRREAAELGMARPVRDILDRHVWPEEVS